jgi:hypothetical protein
MCSRYFDPINNNHLQSINIIHQTAPSLSYYRSEWPITIIDIEGDILNQYSPIGLADGEIVRPIKGSDCGQSLCTELGLHY